MNDRMIRELSRNASMQQAFELDLSGRWEFYMGAYEDAVFSGETVVLPGSMDENHRGIPNREKITLRNLNRDYVYAGPACYRRIFRIPREWENRPLFFEMGRTKKTRVWLDGQPIGQKQKSYTTPHRYELTGLCAGIHTLTVEVDNSEKDMPRAMYTTFQEGEAWCHQVSEFTQTNWNGVLGRITLCSYPSIYVQSIRLRPDVARRKVLTEALICRSGCGGELCGLLRLRAERCPNDGSCPDPRPMWQEFRFRPGDACCVMETEYEMGENFLLWDEFSPNLYSMTVGLYYEQDGQICGFEASERFGMRSFTTGENCGGKQFFINGRPTILRGEINCAVFPQTGYPPMDKEQWLEIYRIYRSFGLNHVRFHTWVPPRAAFEAADQMGFYLYAELPQWGRQMFGNVYEGDHSDADYYKEDARRIFDAYGNSPSFVMFALGNEERIGFYYYEEFLKYCRQLEPDLLYSDIAGHSTFPPSADFAAKFLDPEYLPLVNGSCDWDYAETVKGAPAAITSHEVGQLQVYPDYGWELPQYETAVLKPRNLEQFRKVLRQAGLEGRDRDFSRATGKLAAMLYRAFTESYLRTPGCGGFTLLGLQDFPGQGTALIGLLNAFLKNKGAIEPEVFRRSCCELTVMARLPRFLWTEGEVFETAVQVANYTAGDLRSAVDWVIEDDEAAVIGKGRLDACPLPQGQVTDCGRIRMLLPKIGAAQHLALRLSMAGAYDAPSAPGSNDYDLWVYPRSSQPELPENTVLARSFDQRTQDALEEGKTVLLISEGTATALPLSREISFRPDFWSPMFHTDRPEGYSLGIYVEKEHPIFESFPTDEFGSWQWYPILQNARSLLINDLPTDLRPMVQPIATIDLPDRLALLLEARVGNGRILISSVDLLTREDPASRQLLTALCRYLGSDAFSPKVPLTPEQLTRLLPPLDVPGISLEAKHDLSCGETAEVKVRFYGSSGDCPAPKQAQVTFTSSDPQTLSVSQTGFCQAAAPGIAKITASCRYGSMKYSAETVIRVAARQASPLSLEGVRVSASSEHQGCTAAELLKSDADTRWQSDYLDRTLQMPQWVQLELPEEADLTAVLCHPWKGHPRGTILDAAVSLSTDGVRFEEVCRRRWREDTAGEAQLFAFASHRATFIRLTVYRAMMFTGDTNAASIQSISLFQDTIIADVPAEEPVPVRFGKTLEQALKALHLPRQTKVVLSDGSCRTADVIWSCPDYHGEIPKEYRVIGELYLEGIANPAAITAVRTIRILPKDLTAPPDRSAFDQVLKRLRERAGSDTDSQFRTLLTQAESFHALTGAVQHDVNVWTDRLLEYEEACKTNG